MTADNRFPPKFWTTLAIGGFVLVVAMLTARAATRVNQPGVRYPEIDPETWALRDFRDAVYYPVCAIRDGVSPYHVQPYVEKYPVGQDFPPYSPLTLVMHLPFSWMPLQISQWVYFGLTVALSVVLAWTILSISRLPRSVASVFGVAAVILFSRPGHMNLLLGQTTIPLVLCSLWALQFAAQRPWLSGLCLAISTFKPTYGVILLVLMFAMGHRRAALRGLLITAAITVPLVLWIVALQGGWDESLRIWRENSLSLYDNPGRDPALSFSRIDLLALWARWNREALGQSVELVTTGIMIAASCWILYRTNRVSKSTDAFGPSWIFALLVMLIAIYHHAYDAIVLVPMFLAASSGQSEFWLRWSRFARWTWCGLIAVPLVNYAATNSFMSNWEVSGLVWKVTTSLNGAALLAATVWLAFAMLRHQKNEIA